MKPGLSDVTIILDRSGSMQIIREDTIGGVNRFYDDQRKQPGSLLVTLVQFDDQNPYEVVHNCVPVSSVPPLSQETFVPRGSTPLYDAVGRGIVSTGERLAKMAEHDRPEHVIFVIVTDGQENASREYTAQRVKELIDQQTDSYKWSFVFLGANQDAVLSAQKIGIAKNSSLTYAANSVGTASAYAAMSRNMSNLRAGGQCVFTDEDRDVQLSAGAK